MEGNPYPFRISRRRFMEMAAGLTVLAACGDSGGDSGPVATGVTSTLLQPTTKLSGDLKILQWSHFVPRYDKWFDPFAADWGRQVGRQRHRRPHHRHRHPGPGRGRDRRQRGPRPHRVHRPAVGPRAERPRPERRQQGGRGQVRRPPRATTRSTYNPTTKKFFGYCHGWAPDPGTYRRSLWEKVGLPEGPRTYQELLEGGSRIKREQGVQLGIGMSNELDSNMAAQGPDLVLRRVGAGRERERRHQLPADDRGGRVHDPAVQGGHDRRGVRVEPVVEQPGPRRRQHVLHPQLDLGLPHRPDAEPRRGRRRVLHPAAQGTEAASSWPASTPSRSTSCPSSPRTPTPPRSSSST